MRSTNLTPEQLAQVDKQVKRHAAYVLRLVERMDANGFPGADPLRARALHALVSLESLREEVARIQHQQAHALDRPPRNTDRRYRG